MHKYRLPALSLLLLLLAACAAIFLFPYAQASRALAWGGGTADHADAATASASVVSTRIGVTSTATATHGRRHHHHAGTHRRTHYHHAATPQTAAPKPATSPAATPKAAAPQPGNSAAATPQTATSKPATSPATTPQQAPIKGTTQSVWETQYAALDNDPAGSRTIAYPAPQGVHSQAGGTGTYNDPLTLAADPRWLPIGTRVYAPRWHKYYIMEDECVECEADWAANHFHHVDLYMSSSVQAGVVSCENAATKDQAENDVIILNPAANLPVDTTPLYTNAGGCVYASHQYS